MICRPINQLVITSLGGSLLVLSQAAWSACKLEDTPLMYEKKCAEFNRVDRELNDSYTRLMRILPKDSKPKLRTVQKQWIEWRDNKCEELESHCITGSCAGVAHDSCIVDLTAKRYRELNAYTKNTKDAEQSDFGFSTDYPTVVPISNMK